MTIVLLSLGVVVLFRFSDTPASDPREGPPARWSVTMPIGVGDKPVAAVGEVIVVPGENTIVGMTRAAGRPVWRRNVGEDYSYSIAAGLVVIKASKSGPLEVLDPATGATKWRIEKSDDTLVTADSVYTRDCAGDHGNCSVARRDVDDGTVRWRTRADYAFGDADEFIGTRPPAAPPVDRYLAVTASDGATRALDVRTGRLTDGRIRAHGWHGFVAGRTLVTTDNDPPDGDDMCTVTITTVDAVTGGRRWAGAAFSGQDEAGECAKDLAPRTTGMNMIGAGSRFAASTSHGTPQMIDLATGRTVWAAHASGAPVDGDGRSILVRRFTDRGGLALLDFGTGHTRWSAPDPGLSGTSASWRTVVTDRLVAVTGATGDRPHVLIYDADSGQRLGRFPGWIAGLGDDWAAVVHSGTADEITFDFIRF
ncbi:outer membrane protein assembly factor BamB family protein [Actinoallomurus acaciae]|uniref:PQQ-binding-like beta-propeller repeat protein n=1 Tax=Actinoallomurus acaciae TaxID=502577 RepID=A0ABV5YLQ2_9ACTN